MIGDIETAGDTKGLNFQVSWCGMLCFIITCLFYLPFSLLMLWDSCTKQDGTVRFVQNMGWITALFFVLSVAPVFMTLLNYLRIKDKKDALTNWSQYNDCVDPYMQISQNELDTINTLYLEALIKFGVSCLACFI